MGLGTYLHDGLLRPLPAFEKVFGLAHASKGMIDSINNPELGSNPVNGPDLEKFTKQIHLDENIERDFTKELDRAIKGVLASVDDPKFLPGSEIKPGFHQYADELIVTADCPLRPMHFLKMLVSNFDSQESLLKLIKDKFRPTQNVEHANAYLQSNISKLEDFAATILRKAIAK